MTHYIFFVLFISSRPQVYYGQNVDFILTYFKGFKTYFEKNMAANKGIMGGTGIWFRWAVGGPEHDFMGHGLSITY